MGIDLIFIDLMKNIRSDFLDSIFTNIIFQKSMYIWIILIVVLLCIKKTRKLGIVAGISFVVTLIVGEIILKNIIDRARPFITYNLDVIVKKPTSFSFPSGSTALSFAVFGAFLFSKNKYGIVIYVFAVIIAFSRIYLGLHYFSDVVGGMVLGIVLAYWVDRVEKKLIPVKKQKLTLLL
ncbi:phosphatase PAP2 family protein [Vallitalea sediminicola]